LYICGSVTAHQDNVEVDAGEEYWRMLTGIVLIDDHGYMGITYIEGERAAQGAKPDWKANTAKNSSKY
jgi:hypothetical protein